MEKKENSVKQFSFIHFNDVYNISCSQKSSTKIVGGASRFVKLIKNLKNEYKNCLVLFSGDVYSPSEMSCIFKGKQMVPIIDAIDIDVSTVGNHEYDFGVDDLKILINLSKKKFPWVLSNLIDSQTKKSFYPGIEYVIREINGIKIGFMGLIEFDWIETLNKVDKNEFIYIDFIIKAKELSKFFKENNCNFIIALTHMRTYNDESLAKAVPEIDIILGGHDHVHIFEHYDSNVVIKSGSDFRNLTINTVYLYENLNSSGIEEKKIINITEKNELCEVLFNKKDYSFTLKSELRNITNDLEEDLEISKIVKNYEYIIEEEFKCKIGTLYSSIDARFEVVRSKCTSLGNLLCDLARIYSNTDVCIINSGTLRIDSIIEEGEITYGTLKRILPGEFFIVKVYATGNQIWQSLENGVSRYPALEGRFPIVSGIEFSFDPSKPKFKRINPNKILIHGEKIDLEKLYTLSTRDYIQKGFDGFEELVDCTHVKSPDDSYLLVSVILEFFKIISKIPQDKNTDELKRSLIFGYDFDLKILDFAKNLIIFKNGENNLKIDIINRINIEY